MDFNEDSRGMNHSDLLRAAANRRVFAGRSTSTPATPASVGEGLMMGGGLRQPGGTEGGSL